VFDASSKGDEVTESPERTGSRAFDVVFLASAPLSVWIILAFGAERWIEEVLPRVSGLSSGVIQLLLAASLYLVMFVAYSAIQSRHGIFFATRPDYPTGDAALPILICSLGSYVLIGTLFGTAAWRFVSRADEHWGLVVWGAAVWLPLWFALPIGTVLAWVHQK
jgi:hypothetical protein